MDLCKYDNVVPLFRSTNPEVQNVIESFANLIPPCPPVADEELAVG